MKAIIVALVIIVATATVFFKQEPAGIAQLNGAEGAKTLAKFQK